MWWWRGIDSYWEPLSLEILITLSGVQGPEQHVLREPRSSEEVAQMDGRHPDRSFPSGIILWSTLYYSMCLYVGVQETSSTISGLVWEAVLYLNSKQLCLAFSKRRDNLLGAHVFVSTSVREMSESWKLPLCARLITAYLTDGIWDCIAFYKVRRGSCLGNGRRSALSFRGRAEGQSWQTIAYHPNTHLCFVCKLVFAPCLTLL